MTGTNSNTEGLTTKHAKQNTTTHTDSAIEPDAAHLCNTVRKSIADGFVDSALNPPGGKFARLKGVCTASCFCWAREKIEPNQRGGGLGGELACV